MRHTTLSAIVLLLLAPPGPSSGAGMGDFDEVPLDVASGVFARRLPFDVPFVLTGRAPAGTTRVEVRFDEQGADAPSLRVAARVRGRRRRPLPRPPGARAARPALRLSADVRAAPAGHGGAGLSLGRRGSAAPGSRPRRRRGVERREGLGHRLGRGDRLRAGAQPGAGGHEPARRGPHRGSRAASRLGQHRGGEGTGARAAGRRRVARAGRTARGARAVRRDGAEPPPGARGGRRRDEPPPPGRGAGVAPGERPPQPAQPGAPAAREPKARVRERRGARGSRRGTHAGRPGAGVARRRDAGRGRRRSASATGRPRRTCSTCASGSRGS